MRTKHLLPILLLSLMCLAPAAFAQAPKRTLNEFTPTNKPRRADTTEDKRRLAHGAGANLRSYGQSELDEIANKRPKDPLIPLYAIGLGAFLFVFCAPFAIKLYRDNQKRLEAEATFGRNTESGEAPAAGRGRYAADEGASSNKLATLDANDESKPSVPLVSSDELRERVWNTLLDAQKWLSAEGVARLAKLDPEQTRGELQELAQEGHIELSKDRTGRPIYKMPAA